MNAFAKHSLERRFFYNMKKFLAALFVVVCAFAFIGCKKKNPSETKDPTPVLPKITLETTSIEITVGDEYLIPATVTEGAKLTLKSADSSILSIDGFTVKGVAEGQTTVTVSVVDYPEITATVTVVGFLVHVCLLFLYIFLFFYFFIYLLVLFAIFTVDFLHWLCCLRVRACVYIW